MGRLARDPLSTEVVATRANRLSLTAGLVAGVAYSTFASFVANALTPVSGRLIELDFLRRAVSGRYEEVFSLSGVVPTVLGSLAVFAMVWWIMRVTLEHWNSADWRRIDSIDRGLSDRSFIKPPEFALSVSESE